jgi:galactonate dehydratase
MRVSDVKTFIVHPGPTLYRKNWLFVKVETEDGVHGWGECYTQADRDRTIEAHVEEMKRYLIGRSAFDIKHFTTVMYLDFVGKRGSMEFYSALSGLEIALWDVVGKALGQPIYKLLGGACREKIRVYANGWAHGDDPPEEVAQRAATLVERGFSALKWDPFPGPWRTQISATEEGAAVDSIKAVREAVGPDVDLLVECHRRLAPRPALRVARRIEEFSPFWYEEPVSARNIDALAEVRGRVSLPVVTGEELYTKTEFREVFERRAADIINPDVCACGGVLELREIAAMAEPHGVAVSPHNYNSTTIGLAATIQAAAGIPNFLITEYFVNFEAPGQELTDTPVRVESGYVNLPRAPGLGIDLKEEALLAHSYQAYPPRKMRLPSDEQP